MPKNSDSQAEPQTPAPAKTETSAVAPMFKYNGIEYPFFVANRTGNVGIPIEHPETKKQIAILGADFAWDSTEPFIVHQDLKLRDERNVREDEAIRKRANLVTQNSRLFGDLVQGGYLIKIDEFGERSEPQAKDRKGMLAYPPELQARLIDEWLGNFHIQRIFPNGEPDIDGLLSTPESLFFEVKVGNFKNPTHVLVFEFNVPNPDARRSYESDTFIAGSKQEGDKMISTYGVSYKAKLQFGRKYFKSVEGVMFGKDGEANVDVADLEPFVPTEDESIKRFRTAFNPNWYMRLADSVADCFNFGGK